MTEEESPPPLSHNRGFRLLMGGQLASSLGTGIAAIALPLILLELTGSSIVAGGITAATMVITVTLGLLAGVLADRWPRRRVLVITAAISAVGWALAALALGAETSALPVLIGASLLSAVAMTLFQPAQNGAVRHLVPDCQLPQAIAIDEARETVAGLLGGPIGGALLAVSAVVSLWANAAGFLVAALCISLITGALGPERDVERVEGVGAFTRGLASDAAEGLRHLWSSPSVRLCFLAAACLNVPFIGMQIGLVLALRDAGTPVYLIGLVELATGLGAIVGAMLVGVLSRRVDLGRLILLTTAAIAVSALLIGVVFPRVEFVLPGCFLMTLFVPALNGTLIGHVFASAPEDMAGRIGSAAGVASGLLVPIAPLIVGLLVDLGSGRFALLAMAGLLGLITLVLASSRSIRSLTVSEADAEADAS